MKTTLYAGGEALQLAYDQDGTTYEVSLNGQSQRITLLAARDDAVTFSIEGQPVHAYIVRAGSQSLVSIDGQTYAFDHELPKHDRVRQRGDGGGFEPEIRSPMPGKILDIKVVEGETVEEGQVLILVEAMKMENALTSEGNALVTKIHVSEGDLVDLGQVVIELEPVTAT